MSPSSSRRPHPRYVAAAGNDGADVKHFPAALRDTPTIERAAALVDAALGGSPRRAGNEIRAIQVDLRTRMFAVGSWTEDVRDPFSNCGTWVNAIADGAGCGQPIPEPDAGWAGWSGTSFATARMSASSAGAVLSDVSIGAAVGAC